MSKTLMRTILVVEDTLSEMELMSHYLREGGYTVINAVGALEALDKVLEQKPDVIITDVVMPGMSGFELCRRLKAHPVTENVPIVICSSKDQEMKQGADAYLTKPFTREQILRAIKAVAV
jgi:chemotaxis family two-component system response regulator PixH